jgi:hypothetical protein
MKRTSQVLYLTLIDFLVQLIFLGLLLGILFALSISAPEEDLAKARAEGRASGQLLQQLMQSTGTSTITELTDLLTRLGPISDLVDKVGGAQNAKKILEDQAKKGQGKPSCLSEQRRLAAIHAFENRFEIREVSADLAELLKKLGVSASEVKSMTFAEFEAIFSPVIGIQPDCRYNVTVIEYSPFKLPRDVVRRAFIAFPVEAKPN